MICTDNIYIHTYHKIHWFIILYILRSTLYIYKYVQYIIVQRGNTLTGNRYIIDIYIYWAIDDNDGVIYVIAYILFIHVIAFMSLHICMQIIVKAHLTRCDAIKIIKHIMAFIKYAVVCSYIIFTIWIAIVRTVFSENLFPQSLKRSFNDGPNNSIAMATHFTPIFPE